MNLNALSHEQLHTYQQNNQSIHNKNQSKNKEASLEQTLEESAVSVSISMNAQIVLMGLESQEQSKNNFLLQASINDDKNDIINFLSGQEASNGLSLKDIGYEGKPILELSQEEAKELVDEDGFFGVIITSDRVANFVFSFAGENVELLEEGKKGIIQGFEEAERLFGGKLLDISYETQERTLQLIDNKIAEVQQIEEK